MIQHLVKLRLTKKQEEILDDWLLYSMRIYNWGIRKIEYHAQLKEYFSKMEFQNILAGHSKRLGMPSCIIQGLLIDAHNSWSRCFKKIAKKPKFKGVRRPLNSMPHVSPISPKNFTEDRIKLSVIGWLRFHKKYLPEGRVKQVRIIKKASGWYLGLFIDAKSQAVRVVDDKHVGVDPGYKTHLALSDGTNILLEDTYYQKLTARIKQAQRGGNKKLVARLHEKRANHRKHQDHILSKKLVSENEHIAFPKDNIKKISTKFGKSASKASHCRLRSMIEYKAGATDRTYVEVDSAYTTVECSICHARELATGEENLSVRKWTCSCGAVHDRDTNAAQVILQRSYSK